MTGSTAEKTAAKMAAIPVTPALTGKAAVSAALMTGSAAENTAAKMAAIPVTATPHLSPPLSRQQRKRRAKPSAA